MDSREKISVESIKSQFNDDPSEQNVEGLYKCEVAQENDYKLKEQWENASKVNEPFPEYVDGYDEDFYHDDADEVALDQMSQLYREEEKMNRADRREELMKYYEQFKEDHKAAFPQLYQKVTKLKASPSKAKSASRPAPKKTFSPSESDSSSEPISELDSNDADDLIMNYSSDDLDRDGIDSESSSDAEEKKPSKAASTEKPKQSTHISYNELLNATISRTKLNHILSDFKTYLKQKVVIFIHFKDGDHNSIGYLKHTFNCHEADVECYDIVSDIQIHIAPENVLDEQIPRSLFEKIHYDLSQLSDDIKRGIKLLKNNIEIKSKDSKDDAFSELEKLYNMVMNGQLHNISGYKFQLQEEIKKIQEEIGENELGDDSHDEASDELHTRIEKMNVWLANVEEKLRKQPDPKAIVDHPVVIPKDKMSAFEKLLTQQKKPNPKKVDTVVDQQSQEKNYKENLNRLFDDDDDDASGSSD